MSPAPSNSTPELHLTNQMQKLKELSGAPVFVQKAVGYMDSICETSAQVHAGILKLVDSLRHADIRLTGVNNFLSIRTEQFKNKYNRQKELLKELRKKRIDAENALNSALASALPGINQAIWIKVSDTFERHKEYLIQVAGKYAPNLFERQATNRDELSRKCSEELSRKLIDISKEIYKEISEQFDTFDSVTTLQNIFEIHLQKLQEILRNIQGEKTDDSPVRFPSDFHNRALPNEVFHSLSLQWALSRDSLFDIFEKERAASFINSKEEMMMQAIFDNQIHIMELDAPAGPIRQLCEAEECFISYFQQAETQLQTRVCAHDAVLSNCSDKQALVSSIGILHKKLRELQIDYEKIGMQIRKDYQV